MCGRGGAFLGRGAKVGARRDRNGEASAKVGLENAPSRRRPVMQLSVPAQVGDGDNPGLPAAMDAATF